MPRKFTVGELVKRGRQRADMENSARVSDGEWRGLLSSAYADLHSILAASGMRYFEAVHIITVGTTGTVSDSIASEGVAGALTSKRPATTGRGTHYQLPDDFLTSIGVDRVVSTTTGERRELTEMMMQERNLYAGATGTESVAYEIAGNILTLMPAPATAQVYELVYVPQPFDYSAASDLAKVDVVTPDGEQFLIWYMAVLALAKEESDTQVAREERERARSRVEEWATLRALISPRRRFVAEDQRYYESGDWV